MYFPGSPWPDKGAVGQFADTFDRVAEDIGQIGDCCTAKPPSQSMYTTDVWKEEGGTRWLNAKRECRSRKEKKQVKHTFQVGRIACRPLTRPDIVVETEVLAHALPIR